LCQVTAQTPCLWLKRRIQKQQPVPDTADPSNLSVGIPGFCSQLQLENSADVGRCYFRTCRTTRAGSLTFICHVSAALSQHRRQHSNWLCLDGRCSATNRLIPAKDSPPEPQQRTACECFMW
jgi:hypothetical protein